jgi:iron(III) transport system ATP-binding protein
VTPVEIHGVVKHFGTVRALDNITLSIAQGELFFLLGPSGCGKTTLLRAVAGFCVPDKGRILFGKTDITAWPPQKRLTGMVFQNYALWPHMSVEANVAFGLKVRHVPSRERHRRVNEALEMVKMDGYGRRKPNQLSGGQQQRVALARALAVRPQCVLLDEPLSNLDAKLRIEMRAEIRRLCKEFGLTGIYVTHDQKEALSMADRIAVMQNGRIAQVGTPTDLYRRPDTKDVADFLGETNFVEAEILSTDQNLCVLSTGLGNLKAVRPADGPGTGQCLLSIRPEAITVAPQSNCANRFTAKVLDRVYLGEMTQLTLAVENIRLRATVVERAGLESFHSGKSVTCGLSPDDIVLIPAPSAGRSL